MKVYLAARYSRRLELCQYRDDLSELGHEVTSRWLNGSHQIDNKGIPIGENGEKRFESGDPAANALRVHFAQEDVADVKAAELVIAFTEAPRVSASRGGRHVELGLALAWNKPVVIVGPRENVFCWLPEIKQCDTWGAAITAVADAKAKLVGIISILIACLLLSATPAQAEISKPLSHVLFWSGHVADYATTRIALSHGAKEANPLAPTGKWGQLAFIGGSAAINDTLARLAERDGHPTMAKRWRVIVGAVRFGVAAWNVKVIRRQMRRGR